MVLFFVRGAVDDLKFAKHCFGHYADIVSLDLPPAIEIRKAEDGSLETDEEGVSFSLAKCDDITVLSISFSTVGVALERGDVEREDMEKIARERYYKKEIEFNDCAGFDHFPVFGGSVNLCVYAEPQNINAYEMNVNDID